jgi:hypothetical protein
MNGVCSGTASIEPPRGSITSSISPINKRAIAGVGSGSINVASGCNIGTTMQGPDSMKKSRSQGGKILQKCLSTASYGEEMSLSISFRSLSSSGAPSGLLKSRQYASFGSTTSHYLILNYWAHLIFKKGFATFPFFKLAANSLIIFMFFFSFSSFV